VPAGGRREGEIAEPRPLDPAGLALAGEQQIAEGGTGEPAGGETDAEGGAERSTAGSDEDGHGENSRELWQRAEAEGELDLQGHSPA
jgi:hypothetical protein